MMNDVENLKIHIIDAMRIINSKYNREFDLNLIDEVDNCETVNELIKLLKQDKYKEIKKQMSSAE